MNIPEGYTDITRQKDGGVLKKILQPTTSLEKPKIGANVKVHYVGTLNADGTKFDSSRDRHAAFEFILGKGQVIRGWDIGVATMKKGEKADFIIKAEYAYGAAGSPPKIPGGATLNFEVELIDWCGEDISPEKDGSMRRETIVPGEPLTNPNETSTCTVHVVGEHEGRVFMDQEISFILGEGSEHKLPEGVDKALRRFTKGEKSVITIKGTRYTYGSNPPEEFNLPANATLNFTIFLKDFDKVPATWEMCPADKITHAKEAKDRGTAFLSEGKVKLALIKYKRVEEILEYEKSGDPEEKKERDTLLLAAFLNIALCYSKLNEQLKCTEFCDKALELSARNVKALYRKGTALLTMNEPEEAQRIFEEILEIEADNKAAQQQILVCKSKVRQYEQRAKKQFKGMFEKLSKGEDEESAPSTSA
ncbi:fkb-6 [Pristionchus pacificus]|uniref:peptidylprolyl isomerase n=1 Tax=Pristionchus pacificus TaxID=54126 RepID=A0A2A6C101_PRIPA|nr:fkb-6 [Pristionchus pacificus]|eukprot:PDM71788.1 fkb-6 [Pristionchus pacificus]